MRVPRNSDSAGSALHLPRRPEALSRRRSAHVARGALLTNSAVNQLDYKSGKWVLYRFVKKSGWALFSSPLPWRWYLFLPTPRLSIRSTEKLFLFRSFSLEQCYSLFAQPIVKGSGMVAFSDLPAVCSKRRWWARAGCFLLLGRAFLIHDVGPDASFKWLFVQRSHQFLKRVHDSQKRFSGRGGPDGPRGMLLV